MSLNPEPSLPEVREDAQLPPKSYKDAVASDVPSGEERPDAREDTNGANGTSDVNGKNGEALDVNGAADTNGTTVAKVLRIVDTHGETNGHPEALNGVETNGQGKAENGEEKGVTEVPATGESKNEQEVADLDNSRKSPPLQKQKMKKPSQQWNEFKEKESERESEDEHTDTVAVRTPTVIFKKTTGQKNGEKLVSVKPKTNYYKTPPSKDGNRTLVSGRRAGQRWHQSNIRFAPWNVPLQRRLQTLMVLFHTLCIPIFLSLFFFLCAIPIFWPLMIPYLIYLTFSKASTSGTLKKRSNRLRSSSIWSLFASYFPARLHRTAPLSPTRKYIFGYHPHGIISHGAFAAFGTEALGFGQLFPGLTNTLLTLDSNFRIPIYRDYILAMGLASVSRESCENLLTTGGTNGEGMGRAITIVIGGARESLSAQPHTLRLVLKRRYGFIKMALRTGSDLVPVMAFGENDLYDQVTSTSHPQIHRLQLLAKKALGFTIPLFHARGVFNYDVGLMPYRRPLNVVVGRPIFVVKEERPAQQSIDRLHGEYVAELERLWDTWKGEFAPDRKEELLYSD